MVLAFRKIYLLMRDARHSIRWWVGLDDLYSTNLTASSLIAQNMAEVTFRKLSEIQSEIIPTRLYFQPKLGQLVHLQLSLHDESTTI